MGFFKNPFKGSQPGVTTPPSWGIHPPFPGYNWEDSVLAIKRDPAISDEAFAAIMGINTTNGFSAKESPIVQNYKGAALREAIRQIKLEDLRNPQPEGEEQSQLPSREPNTGPLANASTPPQPPSPAVKQVEHGSVTLVTFSPEELLRQVEERRSRVSFDLSSTARFMDNFNQVWSWAGPILFALGTIGEIFLVLWERQRVQSWFVGFTIIAVSLITEGTLLAISFTAKRLRNRADTRSSGWTDKEKRKLEVLKRFWLALALGVAATQVAFVVAQTDPKDIGMGAVWAIAIARALAALVADCYTAFVSEEKPTSGELALEQQDKETEFTKKLLDQKALEVETLNAGTIRVQEVGIEAEMRQDRLNTQKKIARMQNQAQIDAMKAEQEQKTVIARMQNSAMRAVFDPEMPEAQRQQILNMLTGLMGATRNLPPPGSTTVTEEREEDE